MNIFSKLLALSALLCLFRGTALAQNPSNYYEEDPKTFVGGLSGAVNFTQVDGDSYKGYHKMGLSAGVVSYVFFLPKVAGSIELLFSQKGAKSNGGQESTTRQTLITKQNILLNYAEIPLQLYFFDNKKNHAGVGFSYAQLISSKEEIEGTNKSLVYKPEDYPFKKMDINFVLSGQGHIYKGLFAGIRFQYSLLSIRNKVHPEFGNQAQFNNVFSLRLSYIFF